MLVTGLEVVQGFNMKGVTFFTPNEFPDGTLQRMDGFTLELLFQLREAWGKPMFPSTLRAGHVRDSGNSRHSTNNGRRLSDATDFFPTGNVVDFFVMCQKHEKVGGLGIYFDTNRFNLQPGPMIHIDTRPQSQKTFWVRYKDNEGKSIYIYPNVNEQHKPIMDKLFNQYLKSFNETGKG